MNAGFILLGIALFGAAYATLVLKGYRRRDNLVFGLLALTDAAMTAWRGLNVVSGSSIISRPVLVPCTIGTVLLAVLTVEFVSAFPRREPLAWRYRALLLGWSAAALVVASLGGGDFRNASHNIIELGFFMPMTVVIFIVGGFAFARTQQRDARIVIGALWFRWAFGLAAYMVAPLFGAFEQMVWAESTVATTISFVVIGTAVLRSELFSIRSSAAEVVTIALIGLVVILGAGSAVAAALTYVRPGHFQHLALFGATLVPLALTAIGFVLYPRVERRVLAGLDERRARRLGVQGDPIPTEARAAIEEATRRIAAIADGATVKWMPASELPTALAAMLANGEPLRRDERTELPACFIVPALGFEQKLVGAFYLHRGLIDRDTYLVARDLASRVAITVERAHAITELEDARRLAALGQFAAAIAHDIRTPLTSISLNVQILRRKLQLSEDDREHLDIALEELARLDRSVAEILDFAKPVRLTSEPIDVGELIETAAKGLSPVLSERGVALRTEPAQFTVQGDPQRLRQVLVNLVGNAADASDPGSRVTMRASAADDHHIAIEIEDHGRGIGADDLPRIFEPFFTTRPDGTGLGLAICHKVVRAHGGELRVRSTIGGGSTFTVLLPAA